MKKIIIAAISVFLIILFPVRASGQTASLSPSVSPSPTPVGLLDKLEKIKILKDKIATKVAEIRNNEKKAIVGITKSVDKNNLTLDEGGNEITVNIGEDTSFFLIDNSGQRSDTSLSKIKAGSTLTVFGYYDSAGKTLNARYVYITPSLPLFLSGKIADVDRKNFTISVKTESQDMWTIDIENYTKTNSASKDGSIQKSGFSKLQPGDLVHIVATPNAKEKNRASAGRILVISFFAVVTPTTTPSHSPAPTGKTPT